MKSAVIYARYSSERQTEQSIEGQLRICNEFAKQNDLEIVDTYIDRAMTGTNDNRPAFQKMLKDAEISGLWQIVLVYAIDRFGRNSIEVAVNKQKLKKNKKTLISATQRTSENIDGSKNLDGIILENMYIGYAEYYSVEFAEKINRGLTQNALKGKLNGGGIPMGYRLTKEKSLEIDDETAPYVLETFTRYADGEKMTAIVKDFNRRGIKSKYGNGMTLNIVHHMLKNRKYIGKYRFRDIVHPNAFPAIVSEELFNRVQEKMDKNKKAPARHKADDDYILTPKLRCGKCGAIMFGESGTSRTGTVHRYYKCASAKRKRGCDKKTVRKEWIEDIVVNYTMKKIMDDELVDYLAERILYLLSQENTRIPELKAKLKEVNGYIDNLLNAIQQGLFNSSAKQRLDELESEKSEIETAIYTEQLERPELTKDHIVYFITKFRDININDTESRKRLIDSFVNVIYLYDDKLIITFNYKDGTKEISFEELEKELCSDIKGLTPPKWDYPNTAVSKSGIRIVFILPKEGGFQASFYIG